MTQLIALSAVLIATSASAAPVAEFRCIPAAQAPGYDRRVTAFDLRISQTRAVMRVSFGSADIGREIAWAPRVVRFPSVRIRETRLAINYAGQSADGDDWFKIQQTTGGITGGLIRGTITLEQDFPFRVSCSFAGLN